MSSLIVVVVWVQLRRMPVRERNSFKGFTGRYRHDRLFCRIAEHGREDPGPAR
jgi:hypothetical protein